MQQINSKQILTNIIYDVIDELNDEDNRQQCIDIDTLTLIIYEKYKYLFEAIELNLLDELLEKNESYNLKFLIEQRIDLIQNNLALHLKQNTN